MADRYYRLITLVVDVCTPVLGELFLFYAKADTSTPFIDIQQYMSAKKQFVRRLRGLPKHIYEKIYNSGPIDESKWDITAITRLLLGIFSLPTHVKASVEQIRTDRNNLQHINQLQSLTEQEFENTWRSIEQSISQLVSNLSPVFQKQTTENINKARTGNFPNMFNTFTTWCLGMGGNLQEIKENTKVTRQIVEEVTEEYVDSQGRAKKRVKTVDNRLRRMKERFELTMSGELLDDFEPPECITQVREYLQQKRHVIVTGTAGRSYLQVALSAIKEVINPTLNVSGEVAYIYDWDSIETSEFKLILCQNPFGDEVFEKKKAFVMREGLTRTLKSANDGELTLAIVTRKDVLRQAQKFFGMDDHVLQNIVEPYTKTTEDNPEIINHRSGMNDSILSQSTTNSAIQEMSSCYLQQIDELPLNESVFKKAKSTLKKERVVVLVGRNGPAIRSCIKLLAEQFAPNNCLVMSNPDDIKHLDAETAMAVFLHITGQYAFDISKSRRWFEYFDFIYARVKSNKLRVVLAFQPSALTRCITKINAHELLRHTVEINYKDIDESRVKKEATAADELPPPEKDIMLLNLQTQTITSSLSCQDYIRATRVSDTRAAVIGDNGHTIKFISVSATDQMSWDGEINVDWECKKVACAGDRLFVSIDFKRNSNIKVIDLDGNVLKSIQGNYYYPTFETKWDLTLCSYASHDVLVCYGDEVTRYSKDGMEQHSYHIKKKKKKNITSDGSGYLYCSERTGNIMYQVSLESGSVTKLLGEFHEIFKVKGLAYCNTEDKLYVACEEYFKNELVIKVFKISN
ncbi:uncharacterized protein LOC128224163 isoform X2 [Mya arenaria]|nr:uncharacterized protein LOC128224163 isoform X2 [Mya arenaria]